MVKKLLMLQEIEVFYVLPALRRELTLAMKAQGKTQKKIASLLKVTEPAISQYVKNKRASTLTFEQNMLDAIKISSTKILDEVSLMSQMQHLLKLTRMNKVACKLHESPDIPANCNACFEHDEK